jgi:hypothetical protein
MTQVSEYLPSKYQALSIAKKEKKNITTSAPQPQNLENKPSLYPKAIILGKIKIINPEPSTFLF